MKKLLNDRPGGVCFVWLMPIALAVLTIFGLLAALLGSGIWHGLAWLALAIPIGTAAWFGCRQIH